MHPNSSVQKYLDTGGGSRHAGLAYSPAAQRQTQRRPRNPVGVVLRLSEAALNRQEGLHRLLHGQGRCSQRPTLRAGRQMFLCAGAQMMLAESKHGADEAVRFPFQFNSLVFQSTLFHLQTPERLEQPRLTHSPKQKPSFSLKAADNTAQEGTGPPAPLICRAQRHQEHAPCGMLIWTPYCARQLGREFLFHLLGCGITCGLLMKSCLLTSEFK